MSKSKTSMRAIGKYLREVSVVVLGVAITLSLTVWINNKSEKRDVILYLNAIKIELQENIKEIEDNMDFFQEQVRYADYLKWHGKTLDTANNYKYRWYVSTPSMNTYAFEMFKFSGFMRLMDNKELLLSIWKAYNYMSSLENLLQEGFKWKIDEIKQEMYSRSQGEQFKTMPMYNFYTTPWPYNMLFQCESTLEKLKETVEKLESK